MFILEKENILVGLRDRAFSAGIEKQMRELSLLLRGLTLELTTSQIQITIAVCCLGTCSYPLSFTIRLHGIN